MIHHWTPADTDKWGVDGLAMVRGIFEQRGEVIPTAFLLAVRDPRTHADLTPPGIIALYPSELANNDHKDEFLCHVRDMAQKTGALGCVFTAEAWWACAETKDAADEIRSYTRRNALGEHPARREVVWYVYQRRGVARVRSWAANIVRADGVVTLEPFVEDSKPDTRLIGRFTSLMPETN